MAEMTTTKKQKIVSRGKCKEKARVGIHEIFTNKKEKPWDKVTGLILELEHRPMVILRILQGTLLKI